jgi:NodT family efflux transporter outer membrane factor (OMF) lipoprotein
VQATRARVAVARQQAIAAGAARKPRLDAVLRGEDSDFDAREPGGGARLGGQGIGEDEQAQHTGGAMLSWELDIWGRLTDRQSAARAAAEISEQEWRAARLSLAGRVAQAWFSAIEAQQQVRVAAERVDALQRTEALARSRFRRGLIDSVDVRLAGTDLATAEALLSDRRRQAETRIRELERLLGRYPSGALSVRGALPALDEPVPAGLPMALLSRRSDILAADAAFAQAGYEHAAAGKNRLPSVRLTAEGGAISRQFAELLDPAALAARWVAELVQPIYVGGRLRAEVAASEALVAQRAAEYADVALRAFEEVETALLAERHLARQQQRLEAAARRARDGDKLARQQYSRGLAEILVLLEAQERRLDAESRLLAVQQARLANRVRLHLALGGDLHSAEE